MSENFLEKKNVAIFSKPERSRKEMGLSKLQVLDDGQLPFYFVNGAEYHLGTVLKKRVHGDYWARVKATVWGGTVSAVKYTDPKTLDDKAIDFFGSRYDVSKMRKPKKLKKSLIVKKKVDFGIGGGLEYLSAGLNASKVSYKSFTMNEYQVISLDLKKVENIVKNIKDADYVDGVYYIVCGLLCCSHFTFNLDKKIASDGFVQIKENCKKANFDVKLESGQIVDLQVPKDSVNGEKKLNHQCPSDALVVGVQLYRIGVKAGKCFEYGETYGGNSSGDLDIRIGDSTSIISDEALEDTFNYKGEKQQKGEKVSEKVAGKKRTKHYASSSPSKKSKTEVDKGELQKLGLSTCGELKELLAHHEKQSKFSIFAR